jgi:uncharacterized protein (TIGR03083 family)
MSFPEIDAFAQECAAVDETLAAIRAGAWNEPGLGSWNLAQLVMHLVRGATRIMEYLPQPAGPEPEVDRIAYWQFDAEAAAPGVAQRAVEDAQDVDPDTLPGRFTVGWMASAAAARDHGPAQLLPTFRGTMRVDEYTATRVVEIVVHHMDVRAALELPPASTPAAARMTMAILEGLLGEPRPRNMGRTRFIQAATGRLAVDDPRFPLVR